jgi:phosphoribosylformylglycinamidine (FGAM) synthase-like enzyme
LLISAIGYLADVAQAMSMNLKQPGATFYLLGEFSPAFGGSHFARLFGIPAQGSRQAPLPSPLAPALYRALHRVIEQGSIVNACHDLSEGGLAVAAAEMCIAGQLGLSLELPDDSDPWVWLFGETAGCFLVEVKAGAEADFEAHFEAHPVLRLGSVRPHPGFHVSQAGQLLFTLPVNKLAQAWRTPLV